MKDKDKMSPMKPIIDRVLDTRGLLCPQPTVMTMNTLNEMKPGQVLEVISNDENAKEAIPSLCADKGCKMFSMTENDGLIHFIIIK